MAFPHKIKIASAYLKSIVFYQINIVLYITIHLDVWFFVKN